MTMGDNGGVLAEDELPARVRSLRGMERVMPALEGGPRCFLVGGAVRDLLLEREPLDVDVAVEGDAEAVAARVADALGGEVRAHERFGTATVVAGGADAVNLARTRRETYAAPGALPDVEPAGLTDDLARRDFTVNALALDLTADKALVDPHGGQEDLRDGLIRILHPASFRDDPTRLLRAVRYAARLDFQLEAVTERLAREASQEGALGTVSGSRIRDELIDLLTEDEAPRAAELLRDLDLDVALHEGLHADSELVASAKLGAAETGADPALVALAALAIGGVGASLAAWIDGLGLLAAERDAVLRAAERAPDLAHGLRSELRPSELRALLDGEPPEALALALALGSPAKPVLDYVSRLRAVRLEIDGNDLLAAGLAESPALGRALDATLARKLDGEVHGRDEELRVALEIAKERP